MQDSKPAKPSDSGGRPVAIMDVSTGGVRWRRELRTKLELRASAAARARAVAEGRMMPPSKFTPAGGGGKPLGFLPQHARRRVVHRQPQAPSMRAAPVLKDPASSCTSRERPRSAATLDAGVGTTDTGISSSGAWVDAQMQDITWRTGSVGRPRSAPSNSMAQKNQMRILRIERGPQRAPPQQSAEDKTAPAASPRALPPNASLLQPYDAGHERVVEHRKLGHLQVLPPSAAVDRLGAEDLARNYTHKGAAAWVSGPTPPPLACEGGGEADTERAMVIARAVNDVRDDDLAIESVLAVCPASLCRRACATHVRACSQFNHRHHQRTGDAHGLLTKLTEGRSKDQTSSAISREFERSLDVVRRNRFWLVEQQAPPTRISGDPPPKRRTRQRWNIDTSIWAPRKSLGQSGDYYETEECMRTMFDHDWYLAQKGHGLSKAILRGDESGDAWVDADGNQIHDAIDATRDVLWSFHKMLYNAFDCAPSCSPKASMSRICIPPPPPPSL